MCSDWPWISTNRSPSAWSTDSGTPRPFTRPLPRPPLPASSQLTISAPSSASRPNSSSVWARSGSGSSDRRLYGVGEPPGLALRPRCEIVDHLRAHRGIAHDAALAHLGAPCLELRLDERNDLVLNQSKHGRQRQLQRDETDVDDA